MVLVPQLIHKAELFGLFSAEHATVGEALHRFRRELPSLRHNADELAVAAVDQGLQEGTFGCSAGDRGKECPCTDRF